MSSSPKCLEVEYCFMLSKPCTHHSYSRSIFSLIFEVCVVAKLSYHSYLEMLLCWVQETLHLIAALLRCDVVRNVCSSSFVRVLRTSEQFQRRYTLLTFVPSLEELFSFISLPARRAWCSY